MLAVFTVKGTFEVLSHGESNVFFVAVVNVIVDDLTTMFLNECLKRYLIDDKFIDDKSRSDPDVQALDI